MLGRSTLVVSQFFAEWRKEENARKRAKREETSFDYAARPSDAVLLSAKSTQRTLTCTYFINAQVYASAVVAVQQGWDPEELMDSASA